MRAVSSIIALFTMLCASVVVLSAPREKHETISGRIVAYDTFSALACLNGNSYYSMIVGVEKPNKSYPPFVEVHFSVPCGKQPQFLNTKSLVQEFRLIRDKQYDHVLEEFATPIDAATGATKGKPGTPIPRWRFVSGAEDEKLPFGETLPSFRSADLPTTPVL